jgi:hypothetical protein
MDSIGFHPSSFCGLQLKPQKADEGFVYSTILASSSLEEERVNLITMKHADTPYIKCPSVCHNHFSMCKQRGQKSPPSILRNTMVSFQSKASFYQRDMLRAMPATQKSMRVALLTTMRSLFDANTASREATLYAFQEMFGVITIAGFT